MKVKLDNVWAFVEGERHELYWLDAALSVPNPGARWGGPVEHRFFHREPTNNLPGNRFLSGHLRQVLAAAKQDGRPVEVDDQRLGPAPDPQLPPPDLAWLRPYQREAVAAALKRTRGLIWAPTASGKTEIAAGIVRSLPGCRLGFLVHRTNLATQARDRFALRMPEVKVGFIGEGTFQTERVTVATFQTLWSKITSADRDTLLWLRGLDGVIVDEVHTLPAETFSRTLQHAKGAYYRIGLSGTPLAQGDLRAMGVRGACGGVIYRITADVLVEAGLVARPTIRMVEVDQPFTHPPAIGRFAQARLWRTVQAQLVVGSAPRNQAVVEIAAKAQKPAMVFVQSLKHGQAITRSLRASGLRAEFVEGKVPTEQRAAAVKRLERGDSDVLVATVVFNEGVDVPCLRSVVIASGGKSPVAAIQRVGRGMRTADGKSTFEVWDIKDRGCRMLERHSADRARAYRQEGYEVRFASLADLRL